jgi:glucose/arabinose dehydrogenase
VVQVFDNDPSVNTSSVFIDISVRVNSFFSEAGLLGMAFHPNFPANPQVFLSYTSTGAPLISNVTRFVSLDGGATLDPTSEIPIMTVLQDFSNHNGGNIVFGPDGFLFAGWGDGGGGGDQLNRAQDTSNLLGTITRIDVDGAIPYAVPGDNPFAGASVCQAGFAIGSANCPEIHAWGLRNPWRWSFDSLTGDLWVGDVGQNEWEEIDRVERSMNYGWREREGAHCFNPATNCGTAFVDPITEYSHADGNSVTGGYVYRGLAIVELQGHYVYGDFGSGRIWSVPANSSQGTIGIELLDTTHNISSFAQDIDGELYLLDYGPGEIHQIIDAP